MNWIKNALRHLLGTNNATPSYDTLTREDVDAAMMVPKARTKLIEFSIQEYDRNPYYKSVITKFAGHIIGPVPTILAMTDNEDENNQVEDSHRNWLVTNGVASAYREMIKKEALTGLGLMLKHKKDNHGIFPLELGYKVYGADSLRNPWDAVPEDRIVNGIEYDINWNIVKFHFIEEDIKNTPYLYKYETKAYAVKDVIYWAHGYDAGRLEPRPRCVQAFTIYPYIRRYLEAIIQGEEFRTSFPMAVELDPTIYGPSAKRDNPPKGILRYKPNIIPTLPVGAKLNGIPGSGSSSADKTVLLRAMAGAAALCVDMPANLAMADSSGSNMASAQVDIQPWKNKVEAERIDIEPVLRRSFKDFWEAGTLVSNLLPVRARARYKDYFPHLYLFAGLFHHPDPLKNANARKVDLASGATTLNKIYSEMGLNPRRQLTLEAKLLGISYEELVQILLTSRSKEVIQIIGEPNEETN